MKRKKWSELEERTLLAKYSELLKSGTLAKLKTREKKFKPIAEHVNSMHHIHDPITFPFKWSWRDVSIKVQNMRHQYLGVKQKIRVSKDEFNWNDGENHWENFLKYKEVFGDVELDPKGKKLCDNVNVFGDCGDLGFGIDCEDLEEDDEEESLEGEDDDDDEDVGGRCGGGSGGGGDGGDGGDGGGSDDDDDDDDDSGGGDGEVGDEIVGSEGEFGAVREIGDVGFARKRKLKTGLAVNRRLRVASAQILELRDVVLKREERRRERDCKREKGEANKEEKRKEAEHRREKRRNEREEGLDNRELELEEMQAMWVRKEYEKRLRLEREFNEEERWSRMRMEEKREEDEMEWRERMVGMQIEHEKQMMQMHAEACQNQMQILGLMARLVCQFVGWANDGLGGGLGSLPPQVLQNLQHPGGLGDNGKPDANSPSKFI